MAWYDEEVSSTSHLQEWALSGKNAVAQPGETVIVRFLPHPSTASLFARGKEDVDNYDSLARNPFVHINAHWYSTVSGTRRRVLCPRTAPENIAVSDRTCELCKLDVRLDRRVAVNAYVIKAATNEIVRTHDGKVDVRLMLLSRRIYDDILSMIRGPFGVGDITHPFTGRHVSMTRPAKVTEPWRLRTEPNPSRLRVDDPVNFLLSLTPPEEAIEAALASQRIDAIDIDATLEYSRRDSVFGTQTTPPTPSTGGNTPVLF